MDKEDFASDSDESDEDFHPDGNESDIPSEEESDYAGSSSDDNQVTTVKQGTTKKRRKKKSNNAIPVAAVVSKQEVVESPGDDAEKKRADALWADFLGDTNDTPAPRAQKQNGVLATSSSAATGSTKPRADPTVKPEPEKVKITEIFEFAGEEVRVTKEVDAAEASQDKPTAPGSSNIRKLPPPRFGIANKRPGVGGGLNSILGQINKKNKISVLEKTKLDWDSFKSNEGLSEDLQTFNKGKDGYLERQDFLQRTDVRQFELEKNLRQTTKRSNR